MRDDREVTLPTNRLETASFLFGYFENVGQTGGTELGSRTFYNNIRN